MFGDHASHMTMNRAAYGDAQAALMSGGGGGYSSYSDDPLSAVGSAIRPVMYSPPARIHTGFGGQYMQPNTFFGAAAGFFGTRDPSRSMMSADHAYQSASDFGERVGGGMAFGMAAAGGMAAGAMASPAVAAMSSGVMSALGASGTGMVASGIRGAAAFAGGAFLAPMAGMALAGEVTTAVSERREMQGFLETASFRFTSAGSPMADSRTRGMSRDARREFTEFARGMDVSDKFMDMGDLQQVLESGTSKGMFAGSNDIESFKKKFKEVTEAVKMVTRTLGQTLEEGMKTLQELKHIGVDPSAAGGMISQADSLGRMAGRTGSEMLSVGLQGAEVFRGTGVSMGIGAQANMMNLASIRASRDANALSNEAIMQAGGEEALAQRMTASGLAFAQSGMGRGMTAAFVQGGQFNANSFVSNVMSGGGDIRELGTQAARNISNPADLIRFQANQAQIITDMGKTFGGQGLQMAQMSGAMAQASMLSQSTGVDMKSAFAATMLSQGASQSEVDARMAMITNASGNFSAAQTAAGQTRNAQTIEDASRNFVLNRAGAAIGDVWKSAVDMAARPLNATVDAISEGFVKFKEEQLMGVQRGSATGVSDRAGRDVDASTIAKVMGGRGVNLDKGGAFATTSGEALVEAIESGAFKGAGITSKDITATIGTAEGRNLIQKHMKGGAINLGTIQGARAVITEETLEKAANYARNSQITYTEAANMEQAGLLDEYKNLDVGQLVASGGLSKIKSVDDAVSAVFGAGKTQGDISTKEMAFLKNKFKGTQLEGMFDKESKMLSSAIQAEHGVSVARMQEGRKAYDEGMSDLSDIAGFKVSNEAAGFLAEAAQVEKKGDKYAAENLRNQAAALMMKDAKSFSDVETMLTKVKGGAAGDALDKVNAGASVIRQAQAAIGGDLLGGALISDISSKEMDKSSVADRDALTAVAAKISSSGSIADLTGDDMKALSKGGKNAQALLSKVESLNKLKGDSGDLSKLERSDLRERLSSTLGDKGAADIIKRMDAGEKVNFDMIATEAKKSFTADVAGKEQASAAGLGTSEKGGQSAAQLAQAQTSINLQVLAAMEALAKRIR